MIEHQLARANWLANESDAAIEFADRALGRAERIDDVALIADILITKGSLVWQSGRGHEGYALLSGLARTWLRANALTRHVARGLLNLSASASGTDQRQAYDRRARGSIAVARRFGLRSSALRRRPAMRSSPPLPSVSGRGPTSEAERLLE